MQILTTPAARARVAFVVPRWTPSDPDEDCQGTPYRCFPVVGALLRRGYEVIWFDQVPDWDRQDRTAELREAMRTVDVALVWTAELWPAAQLANMRKFAGMLRSWNPDLKLVAGGVFISICPPESLDVDGPWTCFLRGFGEDHAPELLDAILAGRPPDVPGAVWRQDGRLHHRPIRSRARYPMDDNVEAYRRIDLSPYVQRQGGIFGNGEPTLVIGTARGCAKGCAFCYWRAEAPAIASAESIVALVGDLRDRYGVRQFHLAELDFFTNRSRPLRLARLWRERLPDCIWFSLCSPVDAIRFSAQEWDALAAGGLRKIEFGTETGSPRMLAVIGKRHTPDDVLRLNGMMVERGVHVLHNFIFGIPGETAADRRQSAGLIRLLQAQGRDSVVFAVRLYQAAPGTPLGDVALREAEFPRSLDEFEGYRISYGDTASRAMPWVGAADERDAKRLAHHYLPLATSRLPVKRGWRRPVYLALRRLAWWRARRQELRFGIDRWLYDRVLGATLTRTWRP